MKIILSQDVKSVGKKGEIVDVKDGYAKNFILPKKLGVIATNENLNNLKLHKANDERVAAQNLADAKAFAAELEKQSVVVKMKGGEGGKTFGSVTAKEIAAAYKDTYGKELDKKKMVLSDPIKSFGSFEVKIKLHPQVSGMLKVKVEEL